MGGRLDIRITPSDVGKRVSVRSLTGPEETAARYTDTVGRLSSWADGVLSITRRTGASVRIDEADVVAGKVVPQARPRGRGLTATGTSELTAVAGRGWPAVEQEPLGGWTLRASSGFTARGNSVLVLGDPDLPLVEAVAHAEQWYERRGLTPRFQVTPADEALDSLLAARGWERERPAVLRVGTLDAVARQEAPLPQGASASLATRPDERFLGLYGRTPTAPKAAVEVLATPPPGGCVHLLTVTGHDGATLAVGRCSVDGRWAGFAAIEVAPEARRRGLATAVMRRLAEAALEDGASGGYLQVEPGNQAAGALYDRLGFTPHHEYAYRTRTSPGRVPAGTPGEA